MHAEDKTQSNTCGFRLETNRNRSTSRSRGCRRNAIPAIGYELPPMARRENEKAPMDLVFSGRTQAAAWFRVEKIPVSGAKLFFSLLHECRLQQPSAIAEEGQLLRSRKNCVRLRDCRGANTPVVVTEPV
ncbi:hypothetical protein NDU88_010138 [Pleurodeles waltl]|uniref:Uncharacterized protein n=1 Tax=Pleurodeles waltl TaxID=8319 RepID=A0AAV7RZQ0_PLEWA|nr:hypothetical protein NDU88_010138 [Pleurodeles waltl]